MKSRFALAGDPSVMRETVELAIKNKVQIGTHPGLLDLNGFGRREMNISWQEAYGLVVYQIGPLQVFVSKRREDAACEATWSAL